MRSAPFFANGSKGAHSAAELSAGRTLLVFQIRSEKKEADTESCADWYAYVFVRILWALRGNSIALSIFLQE
jgi:hypothetical protein